MEYRYTISKTWDGKDINASSFHCFDFFFGNDFLEISMKCPFYNDPKPSSPNLWSYEVIEFFFLGKKEDYLEIEVSPHGQSLVLAFQGSRNCINKSLCLPFVECNINNNVWIGKVRVPYGFLPNSCDKMNAYAIHGLSSNRRYYALYPAENESTPDFHRLKYFQSWSPTLKLNHSSLW